MKLKRTLGWAALAIFLLLGALLILLKNDSFQQWTLRRVESIAKAAGVQFTAQHVRIDWLHLQLALDKVTFTDARQGLTLAADSALVRLPWSVFTASTKVISNLEIDNLKIRMISPETFIPEPSGEPTRLPRLRFDRLIVRHGAFEYSNQSMAFHVPDFSVDLTRAGGSIRFAQPLTLPPDISIEIPEVRLAVSDDGLQFEPADWKIQYTGYQAEGSAQGQLRWAPALRVETRFSTRPLTIQKWKNIQLSGNANFDNGVLKIAGLHATQNNGQLTVDAEISDKDKSLRAAWTNWTLDPSGFQGRSNGSAMLHWTASDFHDLDGTGAVSIFSPYGNAQSDIAIRQSQAYLNITAGLRDATVHATLKTDRTQRLEGTFQAASSRFGKLDAIGTVAGTWHAPTARAMVRAQDASYQGIGPASGSAEALLEKNIVSLTNIQASLKNSTLANGMATVDLTSRSLMGAFPSLTIHVEDFTPEGAGVATAAMVLGGTIDNPAATFQADSSRIRIGGTDIDQAMAMGTYVDCILTIDSLEATQQQGQLKAKGQFNTSTRGLAADFDISNFALRNIHGFSATASMMGTASGTAAMPQTRFSGELRDVTYNGEPQGNLSLNGTSSGSSAAIEASSDKYSATLDSNIALRAPYSFTATVSANQSRIQHRQYDVVVSGKAEGAGDAIPFKLDDVRLTNFTLNGNGVSLKANGALQDGIRADVTGNLAQLPIQDVFLTGNAKAQAVLKGTIDHPLIDGMIETVNATARTPQMTEPLAFAANVDFMQNQFTIRALKAQIAGGNIDIQGEGVIRGPATLTFHANDIHPEALLPNRPVYGTISADGTATLVAASLQGASGSLSVRQFDIQVRDTPLRQVEPIRLSLKNDTVVVDSLQLEGADTKAVLRGSANVQTGILSLDVNGDTNLRILEALIPDSTISGTIRSEASIRGTARQPNINGYIEVADTQFQIPEPPVELLNLNARIELSGDQLEIRRADASLNGGTFMAAGKSGYSLKGLHDSSLTLQAEGVQLEYPEGLQSEINSKLKLAASEQRTTIEGTVDIVNSQYRDDIDLSQQLFTSLTEPSDEAPFRPGLQGRWSRNIDLDVTVQTPGLVTVSNNVADLDLTGTFQVRGNLRSPVVLGRASVAEGGELYFGTGIAKDELAPLDRRDRYVINRGTIEFNNAVETEPRFDVEAEHELQVKDERYLITLTATGTPTNLKTEFTSDPYLSEPDIITMLLTGKTFEELQGSHLSAARPLLANYLTGQVSSFFDTAGTALGLDTVRIDAVSLASDEDISAKLTVGKNVTKDFNFTFSQNLKGSRSQAWIASYNPYRNFVMRAVNETDQREIRLELRQDLQFGGGPALPKRTAPRSEPLLGNVTFLGNSEPVKDLQHYVTAPGKPFNAYRMNNDVKKLEAFYTKNNFLDARVRGRRVAGSDAGHMDVEYSILRGPAIVLAYEGSPVPAKVQAEVRKLWIERISDGPSIRAAESHLLEYFRNEGYLKAHLHHREDSTAPDSRKFIFVIDKGSRYRPPDWQFQGISPIHIAETPGEVLAAPDAVRRHIEYDLRKKGFLGATSTIPQLLLDGNTSHFSVSVEPGLQYTVTQIDFTGNAFFDAAHLRQVIEKGPTNILPIDNAGIPPGKKKPLQPFPFNSDWIDTARQRLTAEYWQQGFNDLQITPSTTWDKSSPQLTVSFSIEEGQRQQIDQVHIDGAMLTDAAYINRQFQFHAGDPVDYSRLNLTRKNLYDTGLFKRVEINVTPESDGNAAGHAANVQLNERAPWRFRYGFAAANRMETSDRELGVTADLSYGNLFGRGIRVGTSVKAQQQERDARIFSSLPEFLGKKVTTTGTLFRTRDRSIAGTTQYFLGLTAQQQWRLSDYYILTYDYSYQRIHALGPAVDPIDLAVTDFRYNISRANVSISRDTRDDILNATRGNFLSNSFEFAPPGLGTTFKYVKNYIQYFRYRQVKKNLVWASGYRAGIAKGLGTPDLVPAEQFVAGGGTTLRGFRQDQLTLEPGNGLLIMNQELRFPIAWRFAGAAFFDVGNIYRNIRDTRPWDVRYSPGFGIRIKTPLILLRIDIGLNLSTRAGEPPRRIVFGIGQAF